MVATNNDIVALRKKHSGSKDGSFIDFEGYLNCIAELSVSEATPDNIKNAFYLFDKNDNGLIQISEFKHVLSSIGDTLTEDEMDAIISALDVNGDSFLRMSDVISLLHIAPPHGSS
jgi:calmodulin